MASRTEAAAVAVPGRFAEAIPYRFHVEKDRKVLVALDSARPGGSAGPYRLVPLGPNPQGHEEHRRERDGAVVVRIPAGEFLMGNRETERQPLEHRVYVSEFLIDKTAVTWGQYLRFARATETPLLRMSRTGESCRTTPRCS